MMPTTTPDRRESRRRATRDEIVAAAWEAARRDGLGALNLRDLAAAVGMRAPSLYGYFPRKDAIYDALFAEGYAALTDTLTATIAGLDPATPRADQLAASARDFLAFCNADLARYQLMFTRVLAGWEPSPEAYAVSLASYRQAEEWLAGLGVTGPALDLWISLTAGLAAQQAANDPGGRRYLALAADAAAMFDRHVPAHDRRSSS